MEKIYIKIEKYLRENFPSKKIFKYSKLNKRGTEIYGFGGMQIRVKILPNDIFYQLLTLKDK